MNPREGDQVSAVALIVESEDESGQPTLDVDGEALEVQDDGTVVVASDDEDEDEIGPEALGPDGDTAEEGPVEEE
jgi:DNA gyrase subunit A